MNVAASRPFSKLIAGSIAALVFHIVCLLPAKAEISVNYDYGTLWNNTGFFDPVEGPSRRATLEAVMNYILSQIANAQDGRTLNLYIGPSTNPAVNAESSVNFAGSADSFVDSTFYRNLVLGINTGGGGTEMNLLVNFDDPDWYFGTDVPGPTQTDFFTTLLHELTHGLGFSAKINSDGSSGLGSNRYPVFASHLVRGDGSPLIELVSGVPTFSGTTPALTSDDVYFTGTHTLAANGNNPVRMYAPAAYSSGSSLQHISNASSNLLYPGELKHVMRPFSGNGAYQREWTTIERAMLKDIGWVLVEPDTTAPTVASRSPGIAATNVSVGSNIVVNFDEPVAIGSGNISLVNITDGGQIDISVSDLTQVTVSGSTLTVNPTSNLLYSKEYAVLIAAEAINDTSGNSFAGILDNTAWRFTTEAPDLTAPTLASTDPSNGATVTEDSNLEATFSESIAIGTGNITIRNLTDSTQVTIDVTDGTQVSASGAVLTINPTADLMEGKDYAVQIDATAIDDLAGNSFIGIGDDVTWYFTVPALPGPGYVILDELSVAGDFDGAAGDNLGSQGTFSGGWVNTSGRNLGYGSNTTSGRPAGASSQFLSVMDHQRSMALDLGYTTVRTGEKYNISFHTIATNAGTDHGSDYGELTLYYTSNNVRTGTVASSIVLQGFIANGVWTHTTATDASFSIDPGAGKKLFLKYTKTSMGDNVAGETIGVDNISVVLGGGTSNTFANWISGYPAVGGLTGFDDDFDHDGIGNGLENYFGTNPGVFSAGVVPGDQIGNTFTFTHPLGDSPASDITAAYRWSKDLASFHAEGATAGGTTVTFSQGTPNAGMVQVTATISGTLPARLFVIVAATQE